MGNDPVGWKTAKTWAMVLGAFATLVASMLITCLKLKQKQMAPIALILYAMAALVWFSRWRVAKPDEWLLVLRDGQLLGQGIGLRAFCGWRDSVAKFPATIQKIRFKATQVDKEMQGLEVSGYLSWSVHRSGEGPWNAYKYMAMRDLDGDGTVDSDAGSQHIAEMAKAVVRSQVANCTLAEVLTQRETFREAVKEKVMQQVQGWGVWVEAIEIADVRICSSKLFEDLQAAHRQEVHLRAEEARMDTERKLRERKLQDELQVAKAQAEADAEKRLCAARQQLRAEQEEAELFALQAQAAKARLQMEEDIELAKLAKEARVEKQKQEQQNELKWLSKEAEMKRLSATYATEKTMPEATLRRMGLETATKIAEKLPLKDLRLNVFGDGAQVSKLLPALSLASWDMVQEDAQKR
mmetsp:Transcript_29399/g.36047  ORF Transcript_29399/g.36047 Transcript_29399/m.36047 type:complete len:410 (+) Transcript_29399:57-1286(+)